MKSCSTNRDGQERSRAAQRFSAAIKPPVKNLFTPRNPPPAHLETPATPPATRSSTKPSPPFADAETPTPLHAENSAPKRSPHFSPALVPEPHTSCPLPRDAPSPPHAPESGASARCRFSHR